MAIRRFPGVQLGPLGTRMATFLEKYPRADELWITSGMDGDHGRQSHHYGLSYAGSPTAAIDIGADRDPVKMRDFAKWMYDNYWQYTVELIHSTPFADDGFYVKNQQRFPGGGPYGGPSAIGHFDHIHWATSRHLMTQLEHVTAESAPARVHAGAATPVVAAGVGNTAPVWGWDASDHDYRRGPMNMVDAQRDGISFFIYKASEGSDWKSNHYQEILERARAAGIPVLGSYHFLWPDDIESQIDFWMQCVDAQTPWWKDVPWIWQVDAEQSDNAPRPPNAREVQQAVELTKQRLASRGIPGYVIGYTPFWLYGNALTGDYDIWASNYNGSGAPRPFKEQYQGVGDHAEGWNQMSGRKPRILQFASDGVVGSQHTCCVDKFDGDLYELIRLCGRDAQPVAVSQPVPVALPQPVAPPPAVAIAAPAGALASPQVRRETGVAEEMPLTAAEQRELLDHLRLLRDRWSAVTMPPASPAVAGLRRGRGAGGESAAVAAMPEWAVAFGAPSRDVTGPGISTSVNMEAADLGIMRWDPARNAIAAMFGDNFATAVTWDPPWFSPSIVMYDRDYNVLGIPEAPNSISMAPRRQLWNYQHDNGVYSTILPCDFIQVNGMWYVAAMVTKGLGNEKWTVFWQSRDLVNWEKTSPYLSLAHRAGANGEGPQIGHPGNTMLTFDQIGEYVYIFGTGGLSRDRGIWMWRNKASEFPHGWWEPWGWDGDHWGWGIANENSPILEGRYGELSFRYLNDNCVLSYFDALDYKQQARTVQRPEDDWRDGANVVDYVSGFDVPQIYGGYISPLSQLNESGGMHFFVSQWNAPHHDVYRVMLFEDTLQATGPVDDGLVPVEEPLAFTRDWDEAVARLAGSDAVPAPPPNGHASGRGGGNGHRGAETPPTPPAANETPATTAAPTRSDAKSRTPHRGTQRRRKPPAESAGTSPG